MLSPEERRSRALTNAVLAGIRSLLEILSSIKQQIESATNHYKTAKNSEQQNEPRKIVVTNPGLPIAIGEYYASENKERPSKTRWEKTKIGIEIASLIVLVAYVIATWKTLKQIERQTPAVIKSADAAGSAAKAAQDALKETHENFRQDQRPYIWIQRFETTRLTTGQPVSVSVHLSNLGRSPATDVNFHAFVAFGATATQRARRTVRKSPGQMGSILGPGNIGSALWKTAFSVVDETAQPTQTVINWDGSRPVLVFGAIDYSDVFRGQHRTTFCAELLESGVFMYNCGQNRID
jgi:hypothetical protein